MKSCGKYKNYQLFRKSYQVFRKNYVLKKMDRVAQCRKIEKEAFGVFQHPFCRKTIKIERGKIFLFSEKKHTVLNKTVRGDPLRFFNIHSVAKQHKN